MKSLQIIILLICISFCGYSQVEEHEHKEDTHEYEEDKGEKSHAHFEHNSFSTGLGTAFSTAKETLGINGRAYYNIGHHICFGPEVSYFNGREKDLLDFNLVGHYIFETKLAGIYPLIGLNYSIENEEIINEEGEEEQESIDAIGIKFGAGAHRNFGKFTVFVEYSRVQSELKDNFFAVGAFFTFK